MINLSHHYNYHNQSPKSEYNTLNPQNQRTTIMHQALPYGTFHHLSTTDFTAPHDPTGGRENTEDTPEVSSDDGSTTASVDIRTMVSQNPVIVVARQGCCMGHVVKRLLLSLGVNPAVHEVEDDREEALVMSELAASGGGGGSGSGGGRLQFPVVFIGGRLFGGLDRVMATHISGELTPILREAGALWL